MTQEGKLLVNTKELQAILSCGRESAEKIGEQARAKFLIGRAVRWKMDSIRRYLLEHDALEEGTE